MEPTPAPTRTVTYARPEMNPDRRLREMILYISTKSTYDRTFGVTKLNKLLWWSDTCAFGTLRRPVTGAAYVRLPQGPVPDGIDAIRDEMRGRGEIAIQTVEHYGHVIHRVVPLRRPDLTLFTGEEIAIVDAVISDNSGSNATSVSRRSHGRVWEALKQGDRMPYESVFISDAKPTRYDLARTRVLARQFGWE